MSWAVAYPFDIWCPEHDEAEADSIRVKAHSSRLAAQSWLRNHNNEGDWTDDGDGLLVHVRDPGGTVTRWRVTAALTVIYTAIETP